MTMMAMAHPRRYFSLSAVGAIAIRLPPTSSRMYTSSVSDPLANTSKTSSAASSVASGRWFIICSTAVQERRVMRSPAKSRPRVARNGSSRQDLGPHPSPSAGDGVLASILGRHGGPQAAVQRRSERVGGPRPGRHDRDAPGARHHRRDAREERVHLVARDEEGERSRQVAPVAGEPEAPARDARALDQVIGEIAERVHARRARRAGGTGALAAVSAGEPQELHVHLDTPPELTERGADPRGVRREPALELAGVQRGAEAKRQDAVRLHRRGDDVVVERERARVRLRNPLELARDHDELVEGSIMPNADRGGRHETGGPGRSRRRAAAFDRRVRAYGDGWATSSPMT